MWYKQEGELVPFTGWPWMDSIQSLNLDLPNYVNTIKLFFKKDYLEVYWIKEEMDKMSSAVYQKYKDDIDTIYNKFKQDLKDLENIYYESYSLDFTELTKQEIIAFFKKTWKAYELMIDASMFIDTFDAGTDVREINNIKTKFNISDEDTQILTTPAELSYVNERLFDFLKLVEQFKEAGYTIENKSEILSSDLMKKHLKRWDFYQTNYSYLNRISEEQLNEELKKYFKDWEEKYNKLAHHASNHNKKVELTLKKYNLTENPFYFFQKLTYWREERKQVNMMGCYVFHKLLLGIEKITKIPIDYLNFLNYDEVEKVFSEELDLEQRYEGVMVTVEGANYHYITGDAALKEKKELDNSISQGLNKNELQGVPASKGIAQGKVKIIINRSDYSKFEQGDVLVTGMTRPEHVHLMKMASAIVTNEGGITCHAAIVSRELGIPCVIGTKIATTFLKDNDLVEVDANEGVIKKL